jgi:hypothetical protein
MLSHDSFAISGSQFTKRAPLLCEATPGGSVGFVAVVGGGDRFAQCRNPVVEGIEQFVGLGGSLPLRRSTHLGSNDRRGPSSRVTTRNILTWSVARAARPRCGERDFSRLKQSGDVSMDRRHDDFARATVQIGLELVVLQ